MGAAVSVQSAAVRLFSLFLCPGVYCKWHHSYWAFHENVSFSRSWTLGYVSGNFSTNVKNMKIDISLRLRPLGPWWALHGCHTSLHLTSFHFTSLHFISFHFTSLHIYSSSSIHYHRLHHRLHHHQYSSSSTASLACVSPTISVLQ